MRKLADMVVRQLRGYGLELAFGVPGGGSNLDVIGALEDTGAAFVLAHTETAAVIMAAAAAELSGSPVGAVVTRGPGVAAAVNGMAQAMLDRQVVVLLADLVTAAERGRISHQRLDHHDLLHGAVKVSSVIGSTAPGASVRLAMDTALTGRPGPVHFDLDPTDTSSEFGVPGKLGPRAPSRQALKGVVRSLQRARRPVAVVGVGLRCHPGRHHAASALRVLADAGLAVLTTYKGRGAIPDGHPAMAGVLTGAQIERPVLEQADLILGVGLDPVELLPTAWPYGAPMALLNHWPLGDDLAYFSGAPCIEEVPGHLPDSLAYLAEHVPALGDPSWARKHREAAVEALRSAVGPSPRGLNPVEVVVEARRAAPPDTIATVDSGAHMLAAMELWETGAPGQLLISSGLATMGFALPAAIGAAVATPDTRVVCLTGDGGLGMALAELETLARLQLGVVVVVFNDSRLSLIALKQQPGGRGGEAAVHYRHTDFAAVARAMGIASWRVSNVGAYRKALASAFDLGGPALIDVTVDPAGYGPVMRLVRSGGAGPAPAGATRGRRARSGSPPVGRSS